MPYLVHALSCLHTNFYLYQGFATRANFPPILRYLEIKKKSTSVVSYGILTKTNNGTLNDNLPRASSMVYCNLLKRSMYPSHFCGQKYCKIWNKNNYHLRLILELKNHVKIRQRKDLMVKERK